MQQKVVSIVHVLFITAAKFKVKDSEVKSTDQFEGYIQYKLKILVFYKASVSNFISFNILKCKQNNNNKQKQINNAFMYIFVYPVGWHLQSQN